MKPLPILIRNIRQKDNFTLTIEWSDGLTCDYRLSDLQEKCPCAACNENVAGTPPRVCEDVKAFKVHHVGRYALRIYFTTGCSAGIYSFPLLRSLV